jgi:hypothetical protein
MANFNYISIDPIIEDWIEDNKLSQDQVSKTRLKRWAVDVAKDFLTVDASKHKIALLQVVNTKAELPADFHTIISVAFRLFDDKKDCTTIQRVSQYTQSQYGQDCDLEIRVKCNKCKSSNCTCNSGVVEVDVNRIWEMENPWYYNTSRFGRPIDSTELYDRKKENGFRLMAYTTNPYHNVQFHVPSCVNLNCQNCEYHYSLDLPFIETDIITKNESAELLISYLGKRTDENGDPLIPDITPAIEAIDHQLSYKWYRGEFVSSGSPNAQRIYTESMQLRDFSIGRAKMMLAIPDVDELRAFSAEILGNRPRTGGPVPLRNNRPLY